MLDEYYIIDDFDDTVDVIDESVTPGQLAELLGIDPADLLARIEEAAQ